MSLRCCIQNRLIGCGIMPLTRIGNDDPVIFFSDIPHLASAEFTCGVATDKSLTRRKIQNSKCIWVWIVGSIYPIGKQHWLFGIPNYYLPETFVKKSPSRKYCCIWPIIGVPFPLQKGRNPELLLGMVVKFTLVGVHRNTHFTNIRTNTHVRIRINPISSLT